MILHLQIPYSSQILLDEYISEYDYVTLDQTQITTMFVIPYHLSLNTSSKDLAAPFGATKLLVLTRARVASCQLRNLHPPQ